MLTNSVVKSMYYAHLLEDERPRVRHGLQERLIFENYMDKKDGYRQQNVRQRQKLISIIRLYFGVFAAILEIFNVKEWPDLEIWVWGPSRSLKNARFDRPCMTFY